MPSIHPPAKITAPRLSQVCERQHLWLRFDSTLTPGAVWLHAPAGCGKTMAVAGWLRDRGRHAVWYRVDEGDADPATVFDYLRRSLPTEAAAELPTFTTDYRLALPTFARRWFERWWAAHSEGSAGAPVLVLDDYQEAGEEGLHHELLRWGIEQAPAGTLVFILSRQEPPASWARLLGSGQLHVFSPQDVVLRDAEALQLARLRQPDVPQVALERAVRACGGWAAGLVLLLQQDNSGAAKDDTVGAPTSLVSNLSPAERQRVFDYFAHEVVSRLPPSTRAVLQVAAWPSIAWVEVIAEVAQAPHAGDVLETLHRQGLFTLQVDRRGAGSRAFQFHPLFQAHLRSSAVQGTDAEQTQARQRAVAASLARHGQAEDAVGLYLAAGDTRQALALITGMYRLLIRQGRHQRLLQLMADAPEEAIEQDPWVLLARGQARALMAQRGAESDLRAALSIFESQGDHDGLTATIGVMLMTLTSGPECNPGDMLPMFETLAGVAENWRGSEQQRHTLLRTLLGARWFSDPADIRIDPWLSELHQIAAKVGTAEAWGSWLHPELLHAVVRGDHGRVRAALRVLDNIEPGLRVADLQAMFRFLRVYALNRIGDHANACIAFEGGASAAQTEGALIWAYQISMHGVEALLGAGRLLEAQQLLDRLQRQVPVERGFAAIFNDLLQGWLAMARGHLDDALLSAKRMQQRLTTADVALFHTLSPLVLGWVQSARGEAVEALTAFEAARAAAERLGSLLLQFDSTLGLSEACWQLGRTDESLHHLRQALELGCAHRYSTVYYLQPSGFSALLDRALQAGIQRDYVLHIVRRRQLPPPPSLTVDWVWPVRVRCLGGLEIEREVDGVREPLRFGAKTPKKLMQLLKAVVALGGEQVPEARIFDAVWPELDADQAAAALKVALVRFNALLGGTGGWMGQRAGAVSLDAKRIWLDSWALDRALDAWSGERSESEEGDTIDAGSNVIVLSRSSAAQRVEEVLRLYRGPFLPADGDQPWTVAARERCRQRVVQVLLTQAQMLQEAGDSQGALEICLRGFERDTLCEPLALLAMELFRRMGRRLEALALFDRLREALGRELGLRPSARITALHRELVSE